jgi:hypothetical protein
MRAESSTSIGAETFKRRSGPRVSSGSGGLHPWLPSGAPSGRGVGVNVRTGNGAEAGSSYGAESCCECVHRRVGDVRFSTRPQRSR